VKGNSLFKEEKEEAPKEAKRKENQTLQCLHLVVGLLLLRSATRITLSERERTQK